MMPPVRKSRSRYWIFRREFFLSSHSFTRNTRLSRPSMRNERNSDVLAYIYSRGRDPMISMPEAAYQPSNDITSTDTQVTGNAAPCSTNGDGFAPRTRRSPSLVIVSLSTPSGFVAPRSIIPFRIHRLPGSHRSRLRTSSSGGSVLKGIVSDIDVTSTCSLSLSFDTINGLSISRQFYSFKQRYLDDVPCDARYRDA